MNSTLPKNYRALIRTSFRKAVLLELDEGVLEALWSLATWSSQLPNSRHEICLAGRTFWHMNAGSGELHHLFAEEDNDVDLTTGCSVVPPMTDESLVMSMNSLGEDFYCGVAPNTCLLFRAPYAGRFFVTDGPHTDTVLWSGGGIFLKDSDITEVVDYLWDETDLFHNMSHKNTRQFPMVVAS